MDRLAEIDYRFKLETFVDRVLDADANHPNSDLFNRVLDLLDVLRDDNESADISRNMKSISPRSNSQVPLASRRSQLARIPTQTSTAMRHNAPRRQTITVGSLDQPTVSHAP